LTERAATARPVLCLVLDRSVARGDLGDAVQAAAEAGIDWLQIRDRDLSGARLLEFARTMSQAAARGAAGREIEIIVNRRLDIALAIQAAGAHLGFDALPPREARALLPTARLGVSAHSSEEVDRAAAAGADYVHLAPIYSPLSKSSTRPALGLAAITEAARSGIPLIAQGGIEPDHCEGILRAGASGIAVTGSILQSDDPGAATAELRMALDRVGIAARVP
jgi:thiamine-phosphate pyrophosphorylase